jgi:hypothetical protein
VASSHSSPASALLALSLAQDRLVRQSAPPHNANMRIRLQAAAMLGCPLVDAR